MAKKSARSYTVMKIAVAAAEARARANSAGTAAAAAAEARARSTSAASGTTIDGESTPTGSPSSYRGGGKPSVRASEKSVPLLQAAEAGTARASEAVAATSGGDGEAPLDDAAAALSELTVDNDDVESAIESETPGCGDSEGDGDVVMEAEVPATRATDSDSADEAVADDPAAEVAPAPARSEADRGTQDASAATGDGGSDDEGEEVVVWSQSGRAQRASAWETNYKIREAMAALGGGSGRRKRRAVQEPDEEGELKNDVPLYEICELEALIARETRDGVVYYRAKWKDSEPDDRYTWVTAEDLEGAQEWKRAIDRYYDDELKKNPSLSFEEWMSKDFDVITMGGNGSYTCVYEAVRAILQIQGADFELSEELIHEFECRQDVERLARGGLESSQVQKFFDFLVRKGWRNHLKKNLYTGGPAGPMGIALAAARPGIFFVGTIDAMRRGHCVVLEITEKKECYIHENGARMGLGRFDAAYQIRWAPQSGKEVADGAEDGAASVSWAQLQVKLAQARLETKMAVDDELLALRKRLVEAEYALQERERARQKEAERSAALQRSADAMAQQHKRSLSGMQVDLPEEKLLAALETEKSLRAKLRAALERQSAALGDAERRVERLRSQVAHYQKTETVLAQSAAHFQHRLDAKDQQRVVALERAKQEAERRYAGQVSALRSELELARRAEKTARDERLALQRERDEMRARVEGAAEQQSEDETREAQLRARVADLERDKAVLQSKAEQLERADAQLRSKVNVQSAEMERLSQANEELKAENKELETIANELLEMAEKQREQKLQRQSVEPSSSMPGVGANADADASADREDEVFLQQRKKRLRLSMG